MVTKPLPGDHWINGAFDETKDFGGIGFFPMVFQVFPKKSASVPSTSTDNGTSNLESLKQYEFQVIEKVH